MKIGTGELYVEIILLKSCKCIRFRRTFVFQLRISDIIVTFSTVEKIKTITFRNRRCSVAKTSAETIIKAISVKLKICGNIFQKTAFLVFHIRMKNFEAVQAKFAGYFIGMKTQRTENFNKNIGIQRYSIFQKNALKISSYIWPGVHEH